MTIPLLWYFRTILNNRFLFFVSLHNNSRWSEMKGWFTAAVLVLMGQLTWSQKTLKTGIIIDTLGNEVELVLDENGYPNSYFSYVLTPVCLDGTCYPIKINIHWNLAGEYKKYTLETNEILTKIDHIPFTDQDYIDLDLVIRDNQSALADFTLEELTSSDTTAELADSIKVDGVTGATRTELEGAFVPGALYTSHTLWHLVRRPSLAMRKYTSHAYFKPIFESYFLNNPELGMQSDYLKHLIANAESSAEILIPIIDSTDNELTQIAIQSIDSMELEIPQIAEILANTYERTEQSEVKKEILKRWYKRQLTAVEQKALANELGFQFSTFQDELDLLAEQSDWTEEVYFIYYERLKSTRNMMRKEKMKKLLHSRSAFYPKKFRKFLKKEGVL